MNTRAADAEIQGWFCPLIKPRLLGLRLAGGSMQMSIVGLEKRCPRCKEFWPFDTEYFFANAGVTDGLFQWCRACSTEHRWPNGRTASTRQGVST